jgi:hypothetical protein
MMTTKETTPQHTEPLASVTLVAWSPNRDLDLPQWAAAGRRLGAMGRCSQWTVGDWVRYGHARFGERYAPAARITGYDVQTLMNMVYVASRFDVSRRRENLSWSHHETVAPLDIEQQEYWLDHAATEKLSIADLRLELRSARRKQSRILRQDISPAPEKQLGSSTALVICPNCGEQFSPSTRSITHLLTSGESTA